jgi:hypothetical protein
LYRQTLRIPLAVCVLLLLVSLVGSFTIQSSERENRLTVRVLDPRNGKPLARLFVGILVWRQGRTVDLGHAVTDANGVASFQLPNLIPDRVGISHSPIDLQWCSDEAFPTETILKTGIVADRKCDQVNLKITATAAAGELVLFARRVTFWEKVLREIP